MVESGSMHIVCPHCTTSYAINPATLGEAGRAVRCARCKETWRARPQDAVEPALQHVMAESGHSMAQGGMAAGWNETTDAGRAPLVESPSIAGEWQEETSSTDKEDWVALVRNAATAEEAEQGRGAWFGSLLKRKPREERSAGRYFGTLPTACTAMAALVVALLVWRADVVRLAPQTAAFYKMVGLDVNLRGLAFRDVRVTSETVEGKPVLVIEGMIVGESKKTVDLPRLRFSVRDAQGAEIYAWNSVLEQTTLGPGDRAAFKSRLASPPAEGRSIDVRFFNKRDISGGSI
jgi:predicted Zn finger-like uncharacterized protein